MWLVWSSCVQLWCSWPSPWTSDRGRLASAWHRTPRQNRPATAPSHPLQTVVREPTSEQAHLPAEQPSAGEDPRVPPADAHPRGSRDPRRTPGQGSLAALGLTGVLPAGARLRRKTDFAATLRAGRRRTGGLRGPLGGAALVVVHLAEGKPGDGPPPQAGFVVSRAVGNAVTRNRVRRRLRHLLAARLATLPPGTRVVVRALPAAAAASSAQLAEALAGALAMTAPASPAGRP